MRLLVATATLVPNSEDFHGKHCRGNPGDNTVHFVRVAPGLYRLIDDVQTPD